MERLENVDMGRYTSFRAGGKAKELVMPENTDELIELMKEIRESGRKYIVLGNGSNTLICDSGFDGVWEKPFLTSEGMETG